MKITDFVKRFSDKHGCDRDESQSICHDMFELLAGCIKSDERMYIRGFGCFKHREDGSITFLPSTAVMPIKKSERRNVPAPNCAAPVAQAATMPDRMTIIPEFAEAFKQALTAVFAKTLRRRAKSVFGERICEYCGKTYIPNGSRQKYCSDCHEHAYKKVKRAYDRDKRNGKSQVNLTGVKGITINL